MLHKKKVLAVGILLVGYGFVLLVIGLTSDSILDRLLYPVDTLSYFDSITRQLMVFIMSVVMTTIAFDFHASYDDVLFAYFSKHKVTISKLTIYSIVILLLCVLMNVLRIAVISLLYNPIDLAFLLTSFWTIIDIFILFLWLLLLTPKKYKQISFLVIALYMIISIVQEDLTSIWLYYCIPFYNASFTHYHLSSFYVFIYGFMMLFLVYLKECGYDH